MTRDSEVVRLAVIPGDGIGPEVVAATVPTLRTALEAEGHGLDVTSYDWGGERYLREGAAMPADASDLVKRADAVLFGAVGRPDVPEHELVRGLIIGLRQQLDLAVNLRPVRAFPGVPTKVRDTDGVDLVIVRENTEGDVGAARRVRDAVAATLHDARHHTADLGGNATTAEVPSAVLHTMESQGQNI
ncbi:isocitrate/isopropylmalate family dehydrogenase [Streptomyces antimycoticus]|uniref:isocitrate/isopropylmalate family dehydrogenase n=1 Tax=Streptomyces antimycoticus TaxID=68175 RepID=UPI003827534F